LRLLYIVYRKIKYSYYIGMNDEQLLNRIGLNVRVERTIKQLTQAQLAELIDVHEKYIGKIETGKQNVTVRTLNKIAQALNINIIRLLEDKNA
jgi:transcriptional regulator with XRE-family HTH domain